MTVRENAYAKINLYLDVTAKREDGFHEILSVMHSVGLADVISVTADPSDSAVITVSSNSPAVPTDESNIVYRIAEKYLREYGINSKIHIHIEKKIPVGAGLGGGSSDGAATLRALYKLFGKGTREELHEICAQVGSDLPFCLFGGLYICGGRGEQLTKITYKPIYTFVIAIGKERVSTPSAYAKLDKLNNNYVDYFGTPESIAYRKMIADMANGEGVSLPGYNVFEQVTDIDEIAEIKNIMTKNGAENVLMSGSGPSVFCLCRDWSVAENIRSALELSGFEAFSCTSIYPEELI